ncbi:hypothetical protein PLUTE_a2865 [Pseudoalteromonas luteoviolacea DSM 6061]|nr:hypothetical protein [Pseudoalteromonas luteoviolacea DSM 6061]
MRHKKEYLKACLSLIKTNATQAKKASRVSESSKTDMNVV